MTIYAATANGGKLAEFSGCANGASIKVLPLPGVSALPEPVEDAVTFMGNAEIKARAYSVAAPGKLVLADDSGLEVDALGGDPGVRSARFAEDAGFTDGATKDARNNALLLARLHTLPSATDRTGRFTCALAIAQDGKIVYRSEATCEGEILVSPRGSEGFGYDPLFLVPSLGLTMAELSLAQKWAVGHRGRAFREILTSITKSNNMVD